MEFILITMHCVKFAGFVISRELKDFVKISIVISREGLDMVYLSSYSNISRKRVWAPTRTKWELLDFNEEVFLDNIKIQYNWKVSENAWSSDIPKKFTWVCPRPFTFRQIYILLQNKSLFINWERIIFSRNK